MASSLPVVGRWIKWKVVEGGSEYKCKVTDFEDVEGWQIDALSGYQDTLERSMTIQYEDGGVESIDVSSLKGWSYCEAPDEDELVAAMNKRFNLDNDLACCVQCGCNTKKLHLCSGCHQVYYCDQKCQKTHWKNHKAECKQMRTVKRPNPRYPLVQVSDELAAEQTAVQAARHALVSDCLNGRFSVQQTGRSIFGLFGPAQTGGPWILNPKSMDLISMERYILKRGEDKIAFKWSALESPDHSIGADWTSCSLLMYMELVLLEEEFTTGSVTLLAGSQEELFWFMAINFKTFGTVAPYSKCHCNEQAEGELKPKWKQLRKRWDAVFQRALMDLEDVQCMFADSREGCHNFRESGGCPYKHQVEVKREKKQKQ